MRQHIDTVPVVEAFNSGDECPFCYLERMAEQRSIRFVLGPGASYMEPDVRAQTDHEGFCREHAKKLFDYGNPLGNALMLQTYYNHLLEQLDMYVDGFELPDKRPLFGKRTVEEEPIVTWAKERQGSCYICKRLKTTMYRYYMTFFAMIKDGEFRQKVESSKGFCMRHFVELMVAAHEELPNSQREWFYPTVLKLMRDNLARVKGDIDHFTSMFDYRNAGSSWGNSRDAVSRGMEKLQGLHPADPPYKQNP